MKNKYYFISNPNFWHEIQKDFNENGGVYKLCSIENNKPKEIRRLGGTDFSGTLYIGKAKSFLDRVINLKKSISPEYASSSHEAGSRYRDTENSLIRELFEFETLAVILLESKNPADFEKQIIQNYLKEFGELPPLNRQE